MVDIQTGLYSTIAIQAALIARSHTGRGQYIDMSLLDVQVAALANQGMNYLASGKAPQRMGNQHPSIVPYQTLRLKIKNLLLLVATTNSLKICVLRLVIQSCSKMKSLCATKTA